MLLIKETCFSCHFGQMDGNVAAKNMFI